MPMYIHACIFENVCVGRELQVAVADHDLSLVRIKEVSFLDPDDVMFALLLSDIAHMVMSASSQGPWFDQFVKKADIIVVQHVNFACFLLYAYSFHQGDGGWRDRILCHPRR